MVDNLAELFVNCVVLDQKVVLHEFLQNLTQCQLVDLAVALQPTDLHPNRFEHTVPIDHMVKLVSHVAFMLDFFLV